MVKVRYVDQTKTMCGVNRRGKARRSCQKTLQGAEVMVFDLQDIPDFRKKDADTYFDVGMFGHMITDGQTVIPMGSGTFVMVAKYHDEEHTNEYIYASKKFNHDSRGMKIKFMMHQRKNGMKKWYGADTLKFGGWHSRVRHLQSSNGTCDDLTIDHPQYSVWDNSTEIYPMNVFSNSTCDLDVCALVPPGYELVTVLDDEDLPLPTSSGDCVHSLVSGDDVILLFQLAIVIDAEPDVAFEVEVYAQADERRHLKSPKSMMRIDIGGYTRSTKKKVQAALREKLKKVKKAKRTKTGKGKGIFFQ